MILEPPTHPDCTSIAYYHWKAPDVSIFAKAWWGDAEWRWLQEMFAKYGEPDFQEAMSKPKFWTKECWEC